MLIRPYSKLANSTNLKQFCLDLKNRGLISLMLPDNLLSFTSQRDADIDKLSNSLYAGFDPTSSSFHVGNLLILSALFRSSIMGCKPIALIGGATALIGDPSGRTTDRAILSRDFVIENSKSLKIQLQNMFENLQSINESCKNSCYLLILNNMDWYKQMKAVEFLQLARYFRMSDMLRMGHIKSRLDDKGLSYTEFSYQVLQAYDFYFLSQNYECYFQLGGSDQLGHVESGHDYIKKKSKRLASGICLPLITDKDGIKLGKSVTSNNASVWLDKTKTSPYAFYQYFRQLHDDIAGQFLVYFSLKPLEVVYEILKEHNANLGKWVAQTELATEMTYLVHGYDGLELAQRCSKILFEAR